MTLRPHFAPRNEGNSNKILVLVNLIIDKALVKLSQIMYTRPSSVGKEQLAAFGPINFTRQNLSM